MTTTLVTGGAGFIGSRLVGRLVALGHEVVVADYLHPQVHPDVAAISRLPASVVFHPTDVTHGPSVTALVRTVLPDVVVHLAAETGTGQSLSEATRHASVNVLGTTHLLDAFTAIDHVPDKVVLASSRAVYGEGAWRSEGGEMFYPSQRRPQDLAAGRWDPVTPDGRAAVPLPHDARRTEPRPTNVYAATKLAQEHLIRAWTTARGARSEILRLQNVYGPGQSPTNSYTGVLTYFALRASQGKAIEVYEDGQIIRDFVYVDDVVEELALSAIRESDGIVRDVGSGVASTILDAARFIAGFANAPAPVITGQYRPGDVRAAFASRSEDLARVDLACGLRSLVDAFADADR